MVYRLFLPGFLYLPKQLNKERGACFFCAQCDRSCKVYADFSSSSVLVKPAVETGNVDLITNAMAREVLTDREGLATGVSYVNKEDMQEYQVYGRTVILAASACESARLMLNSKSPRILTACQSAVVSLVNICTILPVQIWAELYLNYLTVNATMKMA